MVTELCDGGDFSELNHGIDDPQALRASSFSHVFTSWPGSEAVGARRDHGALDVAVFMIQRGVSELMRQVGAEALAYCHDHGVAHRASTAFGCRLGCQEISSLKTASSSTATGARAWGR